MKDQENENLAQGSQSKAQENIDPNSNSQGSEGSIGSGDTQNLEDEYVGDSQSSKSDLSPIKSLVGANPKQSMAMLAVLILVLGGAAYYFIYGDKTKKPTTENLIPLEHGKTKIKGDVAAPVIQGSSTLSPAQDLAINPNMVPQYNAPPAPPAPPALQQPQQVQKQTEQLPTPPAPEINNNVVPKAGNPVLTVDSQQSTQQQSAKLKSSIMLTNSSGGASSASSSTPGKPGTATATATRSLSNNFTPAVTVAATSQLTAVGNMSNLITQGKILEAVLETPVNTNYPGPIRALISRDVYSEMGENILIPKGSRVIGTIVAGYQAGQTRVLITWNRIILPNGYDMQVQGAPGVGKLGTIGIEGIVDRQLWNTLGNAILLSAINIGLADLVENAFGVGSQTSTVSTGTDGVQTSTNTVTPTQQAAQTELGNLGNTFKQWLASNFTVQPFIDIDQGTIVKIFVNADLQFPSDISSGVKIVK